MFVSGKCQFLEARTLREKDITFAVFGFGDFDRREFLVPKELIGKLPVQSGVNVNLDMQILKRFDGKEDLRFVDCKVLESVK